MQKINVTQIWVGDPMPESIERYCNFWRRCSDEYKLYGEDDLKELPLPDYYEKLCAVTEDKVGLKRAISDIHRYTILLQHGGLYVDTDMYPCKNLASIRELISKHNTKAILFKRVRGDIVTGAFWVPPNHEFTRLVKNRLHDNLLQFIEHKLPDIGAMAGPRNIYEVIKECDPKLYHVYQWPILAELGSAVNDTYIVSDGYWLQKHRYNLRAAKQTH